jgi:hypothetical protein
LSSQLPPRVAAVIAAADEVIALVRGVGDHGGGRGDRALLVLHGAYIKGFRRFVSIRELAARGAGEDAYILLRSLLTLVARAIWVNEPGDAEASRTRFLRYRLRDVDDGIHMIEQGHTAGLGDDETAANLANLRKERTELQKQGVRMLPSDRQILESINMGIFYARIYPLASEHVHFSLSTAIRPLVDVESMPLETPDWEAAGDALEHALVVLGVLLEVSESVSRHGVADRVGQIVGDLLGV